MSKLRFKEQTLNLISQAKRRFFNQVKQNPKISMYQFRPFMTVCDKNNTLYHIRYISHDARYIDAQVLNIEGVDPERVQHYDKPHFQHNVFYALTVKQLKRAKELSDRIIYLLQNISRPHVYQKRYKQVK